MQIYTKDFAREALIWRQMRHVNILELRGIDMVTFDNGPSMVLPWVQDGNIRQYMDRNPQVDWKQQNIWVRTMGAPLYRCVSL